MTLQQKPRTADAVMIRKCRGLSLSLGPVRFTTHAVLRICLMVFYLCLVSLLKNIIQIFEKFFAGSIPVQVIIIFINDVCVMVDCGRVIRCQFEHSLMVCGEVGGNGKVGGRCTSTFLSF